jgi:hypothetical protein
MNKFIKSAVIVTVALVGAINLSQAQCYSPRPQRRQYFPAQNPNIIQPGVWRPPAEPKVPRAHFPGQAPVMPRDSRPRLHFPGNPYPAVRPLGF